VLDSHAQKEQDHRKLPGIAEVGGDEAAPLSLLELDTDQTILNGAERIHAAALEAIPVEDPEDGCQDLQAQPLAVAAVAGLMGGVGGRQVVPGEVVAELPEDAIQDAALVDGGTTTLGGVGLRRKVGGKVQPPDY